MPIFVIFDIIILSDNVIIYNCFRERAIKKDGGLIIVKYNIITEK